MKNLTYYLFMLLFCFVIACSDDKEEERTAGFTGLPAEKQLSQRIFADDTAGVAIVRFRTNAPWSSQVKDAASPDGASPKWIWITPTSRETVGAHFVSLHFRENRTGQDRNAVITLSCGEDKIVVNAMQLALTRSGKIPGQPDPEEQFDVFGAITDDVFREYCAEYDMNGDGLFNEFEIRQVLDIVLSGSEVKSLAGIEYFTSLETLDCNNTGLESLDISKNIKLEVLKCENTSISELDISKNVKLTRLDCRNIPATVAWVWGGFNIGDPYQSITTINKDDDMEFKIKE
ncbi:MAG: hypothetical protein LBV43_08130 [Prevotella sp.]|jgi:hypothetical protein|nr:hypothetical protein [Prevotella sp.]